MAKTKPEHLEYVKRKYNTRKQNGLCPKCGAKKKKSYKFSFCENCRRYFREFQIKVSDKRNKTVRERYKLRKAQHKCTKCGIDLDKNYKKAKCPSCLELRRFQEYKRKEKDLRKKRNIKAPKKSGTKKAARAKAFK